ncbi:UDP-glycosyltransferase UGT5-like [Adelges cooleyi]|uniref:UDP-glycosyltransferase UGT5-like n=1 Tax=Adelges cooleyi TaxID=133065 RepID=UPI00217F4BA8|nr:UDP-glycosyltransferase UGT5-like [Adelges cooleyi]
MKTRQMERNVLVTLLATAATVHCVCSYNILAIFPFSGKSHFVMFKTISEALAAKGHNITVVSHFPKSSQSSHAEKQWKGNYIDYSIKDTVPVFENITIEEVFGNGIFREMLIILDDGLDNCNGVMSSGRLNDLMNAGAKYDLVLVEVFNTGCFISAGSRFGAPVIGVTSTSFYPWYGGLVGDMINPAYVPVNLLPFTSQMSFIERLINAATLTLIRIVYAFKYEPEAQAIVDKHLGKSNQTIKESMENVNMVIMNTHFALGDPRPVPQGIVEVGGCTYKSPNPLPQDLEQYITGATRGVIYFSMGSILKGASLPTDKAMAFLRAFQRLPTGYKVLWKWEEKMPGGFQPDNVKFVSWTPQFDVLNHPNVKLFISHCGLLGILDALYTGVPIIGIPMFADQFSNMNFITDQGCGERLKYDKIDEHIVFHTMTTILGDQRYAWNAKRLSMLYRDRPVDPLDNAIFWIEYVAEYGVNLFRPTPLPWYSYCSLDLVGLAVLASTVAAYWIGRCARLSWSSARRTVWNRPLPAGLKLR